MRKIVRPRTLAVGLGVFLLCGALGFLVRSVCTCPQLIHEKPAILWRGAKASGKTFHTGFVDGLSGWDYCWWLSLDPCRTSDLDSCRTWNVEKGDYDDWQDIGDDTRSGGWVFTPGPIPAQPCQMTAAFVWCDNNDPAGTQDQGESDQVFINLLQVRIQDFQYLPAGTTSEITATITPAIGATFNWWCSGHFVFLVNGQEQQTATGATVTIKTKAPSRWMQEEYLYLECTTDADSVGGRITFVQKRWFTIFGPLIDISDPFEINWDDENNNGKSDRRDSGVPQGSAKIVLQTGDDDLIRLRLCMSPSDIKEGVTNLTFEGEYDRAVLWEDNRRASGPLASGVEYSNNSLPKDLYLEPIYPNTLDADGGFADSGKIVFRAHSTVRGMTAETTATTHQYLNANNTYYTLPHEEEVDYTGDPETFEGYVYGSPNTPVDITVKSDFKIDVHIEGYGLMENTVQGYEDYHYLGYENGHYFIDTLARTATGVLNGQSTAKYNQQPWSALDLPSDIYTPQLWECIHAQDAQDPSHDLNWLEPYIAEHRQVDDKGEPEDPNARWIDVFVPYVPAQSRDSSCRNMVMTGVLCLLPNNASIRVCWRE